MFGAITMHTLAALCRRRRYRWWQGRAVLAPLMHDISPHRWLARGCGSWLRCCVAPLARDCGSWLRCCVAPLARDCGACGAVLRQESRGRRRVPGRASARQAAPVSRCSPPTQQARSQARRLRRHGAAIPLKRYHNDIKRQLLSRWACECGGGGPRVCTVTLDVYDLAVWLPTSLTVSRPVLLAAGLGGRFRFTSRGGALLDLCCGRGGDLQKWKDCGVRAALHCCCCCCHCYFHCFCSGLNHIQAIEMTADRCTC
jgi:hypothetical protein